MNHSQSDLERNRDSMEGSAEHPGIFTRSLQNNCETALPDFVTDDSGHNYTTLICTHCGQRITIPVYCGDRFCKVCGRVRQQRVKDRLTWLCEQVTLGPSERFRHITLSTANCNDLADGVNHLLKSFKRLRSSKFWRRRVSGGAFVIEVTSNGQSFHPHIHCLTTSQFVPWTHLINMWHRISDGTGVYITLIAKQEAARSLSKYLTKDDDGMLENPNAGQTLAKYRLFQTFGTWHKTNAKYQRTPHPCRTCGNQGWLPLDIYYMRENDPKYNYAHIIDTWHYLHGTAPPPDDATLAAEK